MQYSAFLKTPETIDKTLLSLSPIEKTDAPKSGLLDTNQVEAPSKKPIKKRTRTRAIIKFGKEHGFEILFGVVSLILSIILGFLFIKYVDLSERVSGFAVKVEYLTKQADDIVSEHKLTTQINAKNMQDFAVFQEHTKDTLNNLLNIINELKSDYAKIR